MEFNKACVRDLSSCIGKTRGSSGSREEKNKKNKKIKERKRNMCRTIEDGIGSAFDSNNVSYPRRC